MRQIGIFGGTFDPPHIGHMIIAKEVQITCGFDEIWFIPTNDPPHKERASAGAIDRLAMVEKMARDESTWKVLDLEVQRKGKSFTIDTMLKLKQLYPSDRFHFIIGADMVEYLPKWHKMNELMKFVSFISVQRPTYTLESTYPLREVYVPEVNISSTMMRKRLLEGKSPHYFIDKSVYNYIKEHQLYGYRTDSNESEGKSE